MSLCAATGCCRRLESVSELKHVADFPGLGGIQIVQGIIKNAVDTGLQSEALHVLGTAASNNPDFQEAALKSPHLLSALYEVAMPIVTTVVSKASSFLLECNFVWSWTCLFKCTIIFRDRSSMS